MWTWHYVAAVTAHEAEFRDGTGDGRVERRVKGILRAWGGVK